LDGHVDYYANQRNLPFLAELGWTGKSESDKLTRQSVEIIADNQATGVLIDSVPSNLSRGKYPLTLEEAVYQVVFAFCTLFRLFGDSRFTGQESTAAYPPIRIRQSICLHIAIQVIQDKWRVPDDVKTLCCFTVGHAMNDVETYFSILTGEPVTNQGLQEATGQVGIDYSEKLIQHRDKVTRPALRPFRFTNGETVVEVFSQPHDRKGPALGDAPAAVVGSARGRDAAEQALVAFPDAAAIAPEATGRQRNGCRPLASTG
jgi:hypothetical protein